MILSLCFCWWGKKVEEDADDNGWHDSMTFIIPLYCVVYCVAVAALPFVFRGGCDGQCIAWEGHATFALVMVAGVALDLGMAVAISYKQSVFFWKGFFDNTLFHLCTGVAARADTYLDVCFIVIAHDVGSYLWLPSLILFSVAICFTQVAPAFVGAHNIVGGELKKIREVHGPAILTKWLDLHLAAAVQRHAGNLENGGHVPYYGVAVGRCLCEDTGQCVIQILFLLSQPTLNKTVLLSVIIGFALSCTSALTSLKALCPNASLAKTYLDSRLG
jgi:hypothetical protein